MPRAVWRAGASAAITEPECEWPNPESMALNRPQYDIAEVRDATAPSASPPAARDRAAPERDPSVATARAARDAAAEKTRTERETAVDGHLQQLRDAADLPNIFVKASGFYHVAVNSWDFRCHYTIGHFSRLLELI